MPSTALRRTSSEAWLYFFAIAHILVADQPTISAMIGIGVSFSIMRVTVLRVLAERWHVHYNTV